MDHGDSIKFAYFSCEPWNEPKPMAGLKLKACFWYLDPLVSEEVLATLKKGEYDVHHSQCSSHSNTHEIQKQAAI